MTPDSPEPLLQFFNGGPVNEPTTVEPFDRLAAWIADELPRNPERTICLRHLLAARDAAVRCRLWQA